MNVNKQITDGRYEKALAVKCVNGTFVGQKTENIIAFKGIPFVGKQPDGELRWKAPCPMRPTMACMKPISMRRVAASMRTGAPWPPSTVWVRTACI